MSINTDQLYNHSGNSSLLGFLTVLGIGTCSIAALAFVYSLLISIMPIVYINFLITTGFAGGLGYLGKFLSRLGKIRNRNHSLWLAIIFGGLGLYFEWVATFTYLISEHYEFESYLNNIIFFLNPIPFFFFLSELGTEGYWSMFGATIKGFPLWIVWTMEASIIIAIPIVVAIKHPIIPFSEKLNRWYKKYIIKDEFESIALQIKFASDIVNDPEKTINSLSYGNFNRFSKVSIYFLKDEEYQYLSVDNVFIESRGNKNENYTSVVHLVKISSETASRLMEKYHTSKQNILNY